MKQFQITESDLATFEEVIPELQWIVGEQMNQTPVRMKFRRLKEILSNVRWGYGPPQEVIVERVDGEEQ